MFFLLFCQVICVTSDRILICWIPVLASAEGGEIFRFTSSITGYFGAPTCAMFILAMFWDRCNEPVSYLVVTLDDIKLQHDGKAM